jgi:WD40 repeat protein
VIARTKENMNAFGIEIFDLAKREREAYFPFQRDSYYDLAFSNDGSELAVGTRNTIEFVSVADGKIVRNVSLVGDYESIADNRGSQSDGRSSGLFRARVTATHDAMVDSSPGSPKSKRRVQRIAMAGAGVVAVGTPKGNVELWEIQSRRFVKEFGREDGKPVQLVRFSPDGSSMAYFVDGVLHLIDLSGGVAPSR